MTDTTQAAIDAQDPLPESNWLWRRVFTFVVVGVMLWFLWSVLDDLAATALMVPQAGVKALLSACRYLLLFSALLVTYYLLAPSAEQMTKMFKTATLLKHGVQFASRAVERPGHKEVASTVGQPPQPQVPEVEQTTGVAEGEPAAEPQPKKETEILE